MTATIRESLSETELDALQQFDAENRDYVPNGKNCRHKGHCAAEIAGSYETLEKWEREPKMTIDEGIEKGVIVDHFPRYVPNSERHPTAQPIERDADGTRRTVEWTTHELDMIALGVQGRNNWSDHDTYCFRRDLLRQIKSLISFCDFDEDLDFVCYEMAASECMKAYSNGKRTAQKHADAVASLQAASRQTNDMEWDDNKLQLLTKREAGYADRLWWWREYYAAARQAYRETVRDLGPNFAQWCDPEWTPPDVKKKAERRSAQRRNDTAARAELTRRVALAQDKQRMLDEEAARIVAFADDKQLDLTAAVTGGDAYEESDEEPKSAFAAYSGV